MISSSDQRLSGIPRYPIRIESIPQDVDAHLLGGIPEKDLYSLTALQAVVPDIMEDSFHTIRPGYVELTGSIDQLREHMMSDVRVRIEEKQVRGEVDAFIDKYWNLFQTIDKENPPDISLLHNDMLQEVKKLLTHHPFFDVYSGYQIIADIWDEFLLHDLPIIAKEGFYEAAKQIEPNMVAVGMGEQKHEEQAGWKGRLLPAEIVTKALFSDRLANIQSFEIKLQSYHDELAGWVARACIHDTKEQRALGEFLNKERNAFDVDLLSIAVKKWSRSYTEYAMLLSVKECLSNIETTSAALDSMKEALQKDVHERYSTLTHKEAKDLLWHKWFDGVTDKMVSLVHITYEKAIDVIAGLLDRYGETLVELDSDIRAQEKELQIPPRHHEQQELGDFCRRLDHLIALQQKKIQKLIALRQAYLSEGFPNRA